MASSTNRHQYQPLPTETSIRLLRLKSDPDTDSFTCTLETADLSHPPEYIALSYYWGDTSVLEPVQCDGATVMVTPTIRAMLKFFCISTVGVWADALCINQRDIAERNNQVALMADIYSKATTVSVWMGDDPYRDVDEISPWLQETISALAMVDAVGATITRLDVHRCMVQGVLPSGQTVGMELPGAIVFPKEYELERLKRFFNLPWFSRTWVIQEVGLAADVNLVWTDNLMQWHAVGLIAMFLVRFGRTLLIEHGLVDAVENVYHIYVTYSPFAPLATFSHIMNNARRFKALDPRDKIFALLSHPTSSTISITGKPPRNVKAYEPAFTVGLQLVGSIQEQWVVKRMISRPDTNSQTDSERRQPLIKADYNKTKDQVYLEFAVEHIRRMQSLEMLSSVQHDPATQNLPSPSWVPRWDKHINTPVFGLYTSDHFAAANKDAIVTLPTPTNPTHLTVRCYMVWKVHKISPLLSPTQFDFVSTNDDTRRARLLSNPIATMWKGFGLDTSGVGHEPYPGPASRCTVQTAYLRTWSAGSGGKPSMISIPGSHSDELDFVRDSAEYFARLFGTWKPPSRMDVGDDDYWTDDEDEVEDAQQESIMRADRYRKAVVSVTNNRRFFATGNGLFGLGPGAMREGDWVAVLLGADVPFVLRAVVDEDTEKKRMETGAGPRGVYSGNDGDDDEKDVYRFQLVGECYVDGIMNGEAIAGVDVRRDVVLV